VKGKILYPYTAKIIVGDYCNNKQTNSWILNDIGRISLLGSRKKIAKFLMRTFTCRSAFLYGKTYRYRDHTILEGDLSNLGTINIDTAPWRHIKEKDEGQEQYEKEEEPEDEEQEQYEKEEEPEDEEQEQYEKEKEPEKQEQEPGQRRRS
jgi:hypothetical protein